MGGSALLAWIQANAIALISALVAVLGLVYVRQQLTRAFEARDHHTKEAEEAAHRSATKLLADAEDLIFAAGHLDSPTRDTAALRRAERLVAEAASYEPESSRLLYVRAACYEGHGQIKLAERCLHRAIELTPTSTLCVLALGSLLSNAGRFEEAEQIYCGVAKHLPLIWYDVGLVLERRGDLQGAEAAYRECLTKQPDYSRCLNNLAALLGRQRRYSEVRTLLEKAIERAPTNHSAWFNLSNLYLETNELIEAEVSIQRALDLEPKEAEYLFLSGTVRGRLGKHDEAVPPLREAVVLAPDEPRYRANLAIALYQTGEVEAARAHLGRARELGEDLATLGAISKLLDEI